MAYQEENIEQKGQTSSPSNPIETRKSSSILEYVYIASSQSKQSVLDSTPCVHTTSICSEPIQTLDTISTCSPKKSNEQSAIPDSKILDPERTFEVSSGNGPQTGVKSVWHGSSQINSKNCLDSDRWRMDECRYRQA